MFISERRALPEFFYKIKEIFFGLLREHHFHMSFWTNHVSFVDDANVICGVQDTLDEPDVWFVNN
jgi:hypothetical protein